MAWDHGYDDYFEGNGANPYEDVHLAQRWFEGWEAARRTRVEEKLREEGEAGLTGRRDGGR